MRQCNGCVSAESKLSDLKDIMTEKSMIRNSTAESLIFEFATRGYVLDRKRRNFFTNSAMFWQSGTLTLCG